MRRLAGLAVALPVLLPIEEACAHPAFQGATGFYGGLLHPLLVPTHAIAVLSLGLLIGQQMPHRRWPMALAYAAGLGIGFAAMISAFAPRLSTEALLAATAIVGALIALARALPRLIVCALAIGVGIALALDSSPGGISVREANVIITGTFCGAVILLGMVLEVAPLIHREWQKLGVRILGSWIAASAVLVLTWQLAR
ncbi:MAG TPA: HupE/UreJ family protein [Hyphomicrobiaceae bacterium]|nr:HupE/UreJ family protein [Hyphomicrobiaceae bacterium]